MAIDVSMSETGGRKTRKEERERERERERKMDEPITVGESTGVMLMLMRFMSLHSHSRALFYVLGLLGTGKARQGVHGKRTDEGKREKWWYIVRVMPLARTFA